MRVPAILLLACGAAGCAHQELTGAGGRVAVVTTVPAACRELGVVMGYGFVNAGESDDPEQLSQHALDDARNRAAGRGGTHLVLVGLRAHPHDTAAATASGLVYRCASATPAPAPTDAAVPPGWRRAIAGVAAPVRAGPDRAAPELFRLEAGGRVLASDVEAHGHRRVRAEDGRTGFVAASALTPP